MNSIDGSWTRKLVAFRGSDFLSRLSDFVVWCSVLLRHIRLTVFRNCDISVVESRCVAPLSPLFSCPHEYARSRIGLHSTIS